MLIHIHYLLLLLLLHLVHLGRTSLSLNGAGASFPADVYATWLPAYKAYRSRFASFEMKYESIGSGGGKARIKGEIGPPVEYAASDSLLSETDYNTHPDLQMFPSIAGPVVIAFNLPGTPNLNLTMGHVVDIYSGEIRRWDDNRIVLINPNVDLPDAEIRVVARRDKSGTTEIFTRSLSAASSAWAQGLGVFSHGLDADENPHFWNASVVTMFGETNRGVSGLLLSSKYTVGYLVMSDAITAKVSYARIKNSAGNMVEVSIETVQNAMNDFAGAFNDRYTLSLANPPGPNSYPIAGYTYLIVRRTTMVNCKAAMELVRYIMWFYTNDIPRKECESLHMVPLSHPVYSIIMREIVTKMTCKGKNIHAMVVAEIEAERISLQTWRMPLFIASPFLGIIFIVMIMYLLKDHILICRDVLGNTWYIPYIDIRMGVSAVKSVPDVSNGKSQNNRVFPAVNILKSGPEGGSAEVRIRTGEWQGKTLQFNDWPFLSCKTKLPFATRRTLLWMKNFVHHKNVSLFYGLTDIGETFSSAGEYYPKNSLYDLVHNSKLDLNNSMKFIICLNISSGMKYLNRIGISHGRLMSKCCYMDVTWTVKIHDWESGKVACQMKKSNVYRDHVNANERDMPEFWTAPELFRLNGSPNERSDVFSFAIIVQEVFSRHLPYAELTVNQYPNDVLQAVISTALRPAFLPSTPVAAREIMNTCWEMDPFARPLFGTISTMVKQSCPSDQTLMDCMMTSLEQYVIELEEKLKTMQVEEEVSKPSEVNIYHALPSEIALSLASGAQQYPIKFESATVMVSLIEGFGKIIDVSSPSEISALLTDLYVSLDNVLEDHKAQKFDVFADSYFVMSGLPTTRSDHAAVMCKLALTFLTISKSFTIRHSCGASLQLKIGISSGPGMAGVLDHKFLIKYTVFGPTVDLAQQLAIATPPMTVNISEKTTVALVHQMSKDFTIIPAKTIAGRSYWLIGSRYVTNTFPPP